MIPLDRITQRREAAGMTEAELAEAAGIARNVFSMARSRGGVLTLETIQKCAEALSCSSAELIADAALAMVPFDQIRPSGLNPRKQFDETALRELAASIAEAGIIEPLILRPVFSGQNAGGYEIVAGERRWRAVKILVGNGLWNAAEPKIPAIIRQIESDAEHLALAVLENVQRQDLAPIEEAEAFARLQAIDKKKWSAQAIGDAIGKTARFVQLRLELVTKLAPATKQALATGEIKLAQARALAAAKPAEQEKILPAAKAEPKAMTADKIKEEIRKPAADRPPLPPFAIGTAAELPLADPDTPPPAPPSDAARLRDLGNQLRRWRRDHTAGIDRRAEDFLIELAARLDPRAADAAQRSAQAKARVTIRRLRDLAYRIETEGAAGAWTAELTFLSELATQLAGAIGGEEKAA